MSRSQVYTLHLWPPLGPEGGHQAFHYTGSTRTLRQRLTDHALGRGARMLQVHAERGGRWVLAKLEPGGKIRERQLKNTGGASRRCPVCKAVKSLESGRISQVEALARAGWERSNPADRSVLLEIFGIPEAPEEVPHIAVPLPRVAPEPMTSSPEMDGLADALIAGWAKERETMTTEKTPEKEVTGYAAAVLAEPEMHGLTPEQAAEKYAEHEAEAG